MGGWLFVQVMAAVSLGLSQRYVVPLGPDDPANRRIKTTVYVMRRLALVFVALLWLGYIIHRVGVFDSFGLSVLASAGVLGVLVTIAARPLLGNMVAGLQIALTDPLRVGDVVVYDGHWATVCLSMKVLFGMALCQTTGFVERPLRLVGLDWSVPDFSTLSRCQGTLAVDIAYRGSKWPLHLLINGTGIKVEGGGEWHGTLTGRSQRSRSALPS